MTERAEPAEKRVSWAELFFDLVFVFALTQVSALLHADHSWPGVLRALVVFVPIYWGWVGTSIHANVHDIDNTVDRLGIFTLALSSLLMALAVPHVFGDRALLFVGAYLLMRTVLFLLILRGGRASLAAFLVALAVTGPVRLAGALVGGWTMVGLWSLAAVAELVTPALARRRIIQLRTQFNSSHLPERFGLFLIIALGESIVAVGAPAAASEHLDAAVVAAVAAAFVLACGLWWVYFDFAANEVRQAMATAAVPADIVREVLSYGHLSLVGGVVAVAVGLAEVVGHPGARLGLPVAGLLYGGCALYLATFGWIHRRMLHAWSVTRLAAAAVVLALLPAAAFLPGLAALGVLVLAVITLNVLEYRRGDHELLAGGRPDSSGSAH